jgi:putative transposase
MAQWHQGVDAELLAKREAVYERAKNLNPRRWSGDTRNWEVAGAVSLNPGKLQEIERNKQAA